MSNAPVCHVSVNQGIADQPRAARLPFVPAAVDLKSALEAIRALHMIIQLLTGQVPAPSASGTQGLLGGGGVTTQGNQGPKGNDGKDAKQPKEGRFVEDRTQRVTRKVRIFQNNDKTSENWVDIERINKVVWVDRVTGENIVWTR